MGFRPAAVADTAAVPDAVAAVMGITRQPGKTVGESVAAALEGRSRLLLFDNCEHIVDAAADLIETIRSHSTSVKILATSREGLGVEDERLWRVPSLEVGAAVELFEQRAESLSEGESTVVEEICRRLDGIPLAIELAASRMASMTAAEVRDRLDDRFKLLVGSRRGLERHQTLRQAVAWSYDLLSDDESALLERCSVFAGGFDLQSACAIADFGGSDEYAILDLLDALVRKSLLVADKSSGHTRYSILETIRQFAEDQLVARGDIAAARTAHARYFAGSESQILALWDGPRQREAYAWITMELANLRTAFRWAVDQDLLDEAAAIANLAGFVGTWIENYEATTWAEELIESARGFDGSRLPGLYTIAAQCYFAGRIEAGVHYSDEAQRLMLEGSGDVPYGGTNLGGAYLSIGQPERWVDLCRAQLARGLDRHAIWTASLVLALATAGSDGEAMTVTPGLIDAAEASHNPHALSWALLAYGHAWREADPRAALDALRRGLRVARDNGVRASESILAMTLAPIEAEHGDSSAGLDCIRLSIQNYHNSGNITVIRVPLAHLAILLDRIGRYEPAARIAGFAFSPMTEVTVRKITSAIAHLRGVLGDQVYESLARDGESLTTAAIAVYAYEQIDQARTHLEQSR